MRGDLNPPVFQGVLSDMADGIYYSTELTLRDLFAAFALAGYRAAEVGQPPANANRAAVQSYVDADAMLRERAK